MSKNIIASSSQFLFSFTNAQGIEEWFLFLFLLTTVGTQTHCCCFWCWMIQKLAISEWALPLTPTDGGRGNTISVLGSLPSLRESLKSIGRKLFSPVIIQWIPPYLITIPLTAIAFILSNQKSKVSSYFPPAKSGIFCCNIKETPGIGLRCSKEAVRWLKETSGQT